MTHEQRFRSIVRGLLAIGVKPTPTKLNRFLGRRRLRLNSINGREANWRREELLAAGWTGGGAPTYDSRWSPPA